MSLRVPCLSPRAATLGWQSSSSHIFTWNTSTHASNIAKELPVVKFQTRIDESAEPDTTNLSHEDTQAHNTCRQKTRSHIIMPLRHQTSHNRHSLSITEFFDSSKAIRGETHSHMVSHSSYYLTFWYQLNLIGQWIGLLTDWNTKQSQRTTEVLHITLRFTFHMLCCSWVNERRRWWLKMYDDSWLLMEDFDYKMHDNVDSRILWDMRLSALNSVKIIISGHMWLQVQ